VSNILSTTFSLYWSVKDEINEMSHLEYDKYTEEEIIVKKQEIAQKLMSKYKKNEDNII